MAIYHHQQRYPHVAGLQYLLEYHTFVLFESTQSYINQLEFDYTVGLSVYAGIWTTDPLGLQIAKQRLYHWANLPLTCQLYFISMPQANLPLTCQPYLISMPQTLFHLVWFTSINWLLMQKNLKIQNCKKLKFSFFNFFFNLKAFLSISTSMHFFRSM